MADKRPLSRGVPIASVLTFVVIAMVWGLDGTAAQGATLTVTKTSYSNDGICDADCSLQEAIAAAMSGDTIIIPAGIYTQDGFIIDKDLTLTGAGADKTIIQAATEPGVASSRVFEIHDRSVGISGVTIRHGVSANHGGGIYNAGRLTLEDSVVSNNAATGDFSGGGIYNESTAILINTTVSNNTASQGGGIINWNRNTSTILINSTVSGNSATRLGGGIFAEGALTLSNSTVSDNTAGEEGGGILAIDRVKLVNSIIAGNTTASGPKDLDCTFSVRIATVTSLGHNLVQDTSGCGLPAETGDLVGVDPLLGHLQDNGGPTFTHALLPGSPAIDHIPVENCKDADGNPITTDQRGVARPQGVACDIGAYEVETAPPVEPPLDHFWCYLTQAPRVTLEDPTRGKP